VAPRAAQAQVGAWLSAPETTAQLRAAAPLLPAEDRWEIEHALSILAGLV
jgi:hypothetical protein